MEADFFDWPLKSRAGAALVRQVAQEAARFRLRDVETDVLKVLYEGLVDPEQHHDLGEYYTPDWLAGRVVPRARGGPPGPSLPRTRGRFGPLPVPRGPSPGRGRARCEVGRAADRRGLRGQGQGP